MRRLVGAVAAATLVACAATAPGPKGWQPVAGDPNAWTTGAGTATQTYAYAEHSFGGALPDLASQVTIDAVLHHHARMLRSEPFAPCPGLAGVARFVLPGGGSLTEGFRVLDGRSVRVTYQRGAGVAADPAVDEAMKSALCP